MESTLQCDARADANVQVSARRLVDLAGVTYRLVDARKDFNATLFQGNAAPGE
jgi:hypothetical protein